MMNLNPIGLIGYGEVGKTFCAGLKTKPGVTTVAAWDLKFSSPATRDAEQAHAAAAGVQACASMQALCESAIFILCAVTASNTLSVAQEAAKYIRPGIDWQEQGAYLFSRVVQHGKRRAEEMREAANTVRAAGFDSFMPAATADKQQWVANLAEEGVFKGIAKDARWQDCADRLLAVKTPASRCAGK